MNQVVMSLFPGTEVYTYRKGTSERSTYPILDK